MLARLCALLVLLQICCISVYGTSSVTYCSLVKLLNKRYDVRLHSHDVKYGSGSGQQSVTAVENKEDGNSYWILKPITGKQCVRGEPIKCKDVIRLEHLSTKKNLHSHHVSSPLSGRQEVSAYGVNGEGDTGDHWIVECNGEYWAKDAEVALKHVDTEVYLAVTDRTYGSPISGQSEVVGEYSPEANTLWQAMEGLYIHPNDFESQHSQHFQHTEL